MCGARCAVMQKATLRSVVCDTQTRSPPVSAVVLASQCVASAQASFRFARRVSIFAKTRDGSLLQPQSLS